MKVGVLGLMGWVALCVFSIVGCDDENDGAHTGCDAGVTQCTGSGGTDGLEICVSAGLLEPLELCAEGEVCVKPQTPEGQEAELDAMCVAGSGGTSGTGGGTGSCAEVDVPGEPNLTGTLSISPMVASFDDSMTVTVDVDADTREVTALLLNASSGASAGTGTSSTSGNETVEVNLRVETVAQPGPHTLDVQLRGDPPIPLDYILYTPGDGNTYVRTKVENNVPEPETATTCAEVNATIQ